MNLRQAAQQALEALEQFAGTKLVRTSGVITALRTALAEPEQDDTALLRQALSTLEGWANYGKWVWPEAALEQAKRNTEEAIAALRERLGEKT